MTDSVKFVLPSSGYDMIDKIIHAYVRSGQQAVSLDEVASRASIHKTQLSPNHKFLVAVGILEGGTKKKLTKKGHDLALAISNRVAEDVSKNWAKIMRECEHTNKVLDMIHIQKEIDKSSIQGKVLQALGMHSSRYSKIGANCLIELLLRANLLQENDGKYVCSPKFDSSGDGENEAMLVKNDREDTKADEAAPQKKQTIIGKAPISPDPSLHIDVQIHIDANATPEQIDQIFASMAKHLYGRS
ncbi:MAG: hypothetical protein NT018_09385 [Armatimonadetes bacterium]|nr:hypothetical protein [Armatimonadota bacterium]